MRKPIKPFSVEVKRRSARAVAPPEKPLAPSVAAPAPVSPAPLAPTPLAPAPASAHKPAGRILQCLVSEAAGEAIAEQNLARAGERRAASRKPPVAGKRPVGRPRKMADETAAAPRKRGRPRKTPAQEAVPSPAAPVAMASAVSRSDRAVRRAREVAALPRGQRWKRRLPKTLR